MVYNFIVLLIEKFLSFSLAGGTVMCGAHTESARSVDIAVIVLYLVSI